MVPTPAQYHAARMLLIDTSNVLHAIGVLPEHLATLDVPGLARLISTSRYGKRRAVLVCDGLGPRGGGGSVGGGDGWPEATNTAPSGREVAGLDVVYAGAGQEADDVIELLLARDSAPRRLLVVSTDRRLARAARRRRAQSMTSDAFLRHLASDVAKPKAKPLPGFAAQVPLNEYAVGYWMALFGYGSPGEAPSGERPVAEVSKAAQRGLEQERARARANALARSPHAHERLKIPKALLEADGRAQAPPRPVPDGAASTDRPGSPAPPAPAGRGQADRSVPSDLAELLKDSGLSIDPADLDMRTWLPTEDNSPPSS
jgi:hypothetical protein